MIREPINAVRDAVDDVEIRIDFLLKRIDELEEELRIAENRNEDLHNALHFYYRFRDEHPELWAAFAVADRMEKSNEL